MYWTIFILYLTNTALYNIILLTKLSNPLKNTFVIKSGNEVEFINMLLIKKQIVKDTVSGIVISYTNQDNVSPLRNLLFKRIPR